MRQLNLACILLLLSGMASAQSNDLFSHRLSIAAAGYWPDIDTTLRVNGAGGRLGTKLDLERDLGLKDRDTLFAGALNWNIARRHSLDLLYFDLSRTGEKPIEFDIDFRDFHYPIRTTIESFFDTEVWRLSYGYAFVADDRQRLSAQLGIHYTTIAAGLGREALRAEAKTDVPLPVLGLAYQRRLGEHFLLDVRAQVFRLEFDDIDGSLDNATVNLQYAPIRNLSIFVGYNYYMIDVDVTKERWRGSFDFNYHGPWAGVIVGLGARD